LAKLLSPTARFRCCTRQHTGYPFGQSIKEGVPGFQRGSKAAASSHVSIFPSNCRRKAMDPADRRLRPVADAAPLEILPSRSETRSEGDPPPAARTPRASRHAPRRPAPAPDACAAAEARLAPHRRAHLRADPRPHQQPPVHPPDPAPGRGPGAVDEAAGALCGRRSRGHECRFTGFLNYGHKAATAAGACRGPSAAGRALRRVGLAAARAVRTDA
jgi:hypothetical protein